MKKRMNKPQDNPSDEAIVAWLERELDEPAARALAARVQADAALKARVERTRAALAAAREWMLDAPAPGAERVDALPIPQVRAPACVVEEVGRPCRGRHDVAPGRRDLLTAARWRGRAWLARGVAAAAIFVVGFLAGQFSMKGEGEAVAVRQGNGLAETPGPNQPGRAGAPVHEETPQKATTPTSVTPAPATPAPTPAERMVAQAGATKLEAQQPAPGARQWAQPAPSNAPAAREENGRVIVETTLSGSGGRALWVVDGGFDVASNAADKKGAIQ